MNELSQAKAEALEAIELLADFVTDRGVTPDVIAAADLAQRYVDSQRGA